MRALACFFFVGFFFGNPCQGNGDSATSTPITAPWTPDQHLAAASPTATPAIGTQFQSHSDLEMGQELERLGDFEGAITCYRKALLSGDSALRLVALDSITKAISKKQEKENKEDSPKSYLDLGEAWQHQDKIDEAIAAYEKALASKSEMTRASAMQRLSALVKKKTTWWREYFTTPLLGLLMTLWKPAFIAIAAFGAVVIARWCLRRSDLLLAPNPALLDTQWLEILIRDYDLQAKLIHGFPNRKSGMSLITFGSAGELFADLISRVTKVDSGPWRQRLVRFLQNPRFELQLSLPSNNAGGIVTAILSSGGEIQESFIEEFSTNEFPTMQRNLAYWVAYQMRQRQET